MRKILILLVLISLVAGFTACGGDDNGGSYDTYTVTFNADGGSEVPSQTVRTGATAAQPLNPTKEGYRFVHWYSANPDTSFTFFSTPITGDITITALWERLYTVTFNPNGGVGGPDPMRFAVGQLVSSEPDGGFLVADTESTPHLIPRRDGRLPIGYADSPNYNSANPDSGKMYFLATIGYETEFWLLFVGGATAGVYYWVLDEDITLYAIWEEE